MKDFEFDLSDNTLTYNETIVIQLPASNAESERKIANKISELTPEQKFSINNIMWHCENLTDEQVLNILRNQVGVGEKLSFNMVTFHRHKYLADKGLYSIFDLDKGILLNVANANKMFIKEIRKTHKKQMKGAMNVDNGFLFK